MTTCHNNLEYFLNNPTKPEVHVTYSSHSSSRDSSSSSKSSSNDSSSSKSSSSSSDSSSSKSLSSNSSSKSSSSDSSSSSSKDSSSTKSSSSSWLSKSSYDDDDDRRSSDEPIREESSSSDESNDFFALKPKKESKTEPEINTPVQKTITKPDKQSTQIAAPADKKNNTTTILIEDIQPKKIISKEFETQTTQTGHKYKDNKAFKECVNTKTAIIKSLEKFSDYPSDEIIDSIMSSCKEETNKKEKKDLDTHMLLKEGNNNQGDSDADVYPIFYVGDITFHGKICKCYAGYNKQGMPTSFTIMSQGHDLIYCHYLIYQFTYLNDDYKDMSHDIGQQLMKCKYDYGSIQDLYLINNKIPREEYKSDDELKEKQLLAKELCKTKEMIYRHNCWMNEVKKEFMRTDPACRKNRETFHWLNWLISDEELSYRLRPIDIETRMLKDQKAIEEFEQKEAKRIEAENKQKAKEEKQTKKEAAKIEKKEYKKEHPGIGTRIYNSCKNTKDKAKNKIKSWWNGTTPEKSVIEHKDSEGLSAGNAKRESDENKLSDEKTDSKEIAQDIKAQTSQSLPAQKDQAPATAQPETSKPSAANTGQTSDQKSMKKDSSSTSDSSAKKAAKKN